MDYRFIAILITRLATKCFVIPVSERYKNMNDRCRYFVKKVEMDLEIMHEKYFFFLFSFEILAWKFFGTTKHPP